MDNRFDHLIDMDDYPLSRWDKMLSLAEDIMKNPAAYSDKCAGKIMATLFYEPSTRTQMSFQAAMLRLGGTLIGFDNPSNSSVAKGENLKDTIKIVSTYSDILVMRHNQEGSARAAALCSDCPIINAGDGGHLHPTQTLTDMLTMKSELGRLSGLKIGVCGDLRYGRTVHSLLKAMSQYEGNSFTLISTPSLGLPDYIKDILKQRGCSFRESKTIEEFLPELDMLYMTRIQQERFDDTAEFERQKDVYCLTPEKMALAKPDMIVMHPLPRVNEVDVKVDDDPRAAYFRQAQNGMYVRMALILTTLEEERRTERLGPLLCGEVHSDISCGNIKCVTHTESYLPHSFIRKGGQLVCEYCDTVVKC